MKPERRTMDDQFYADLLPDEDDDDSPKWRKYAKIILPHIGLILLSCLYIVIGAAVFYHLEKPNELEVRGANLAAVSASKVQFLDQMWIALNRESNSDDFRESALIDMENITETLFKAFDTHFISADHLSDGGVNAEDNWTFLAAIFFTSTLLTTIGYGNLVPVTFQGRMFCICYGLFGVPLILITVADIGKFLSENIVWLYCKYVELKRRLKRRMRLRLAAHSTDQEGGNDEDTEMESLAAKSQSRKHDLEKFGLEDYVSIPVSLIMLILVGYIAAGALLLGSWENWDFFRGFYFSFITMTTVGFGDIVPVKQAYFLLDLLYIIIGLAITTMCIDLVGIQYIRKIHYFGRAIQDARYALVNVGGRMVHVADLMKYASVLQRKYGQRAKDADPELFEPWPGAYTPKMLRQMRYIDTTSIDSLQSWYATCLGVVLKEKGKGKAIRISDQNENAVEL